MPNHSHTIIVPSDEDGLRKTFADAHRRYTGYINARQRKTGHLWQGRYGSVVMDEAHLYEAVRYVSLNPVRAGLVEQITVTVTETINTFSSLPRQRRDSLRGCECCHIS